MTRILKQFLIFSVFILIFMTESVCGQDTYNYESKLAPRILTLDYAFFKSDHEDKIKLEIYYRIYNASLQFVSDGDKFSAEYELEVLIKDNKGRQVTAFTRERSISVFAYDRTVSYNDYRISQIDYYLSPGKYKIYLTLVDKKSLNRLNGEFGVNIPKYESRHPEFSGIEFVQAVDTAIVDTVFRKGNISVVPSANRQYTGDTTAMLLYYFEVYQGKEKYETALIETRIMDRNVDKIYTDTVQIEFGDGVETVRQLRQVSLKNLKSGDYKLELMVKSKRNRDINKIKESFTLYWPPDKLILHDHETAINMLKYIADPADMKKMKESMSPADRLKLFQDFWKNNDPTPNSNNNELKNDYYERIEYSNRAFSILKKEGWRTDFGMVYIQYGKPDQIEDHPFELSTKAYQIWYFYRLNEPRKFVFIDEWGDGDYRLQYPYDGKAW